MREGTQQIDVKHHTCAAVMLLIFRIPDWAIGDFGEHPPSSMALVMSNWEAKVRELT
jgi:hypothetical protein